MAQQHRYEVNIEWDSGRKGNLRSQVLERSIETATPPEFPGGMEGIWSPEHLFVASVNSCLMTTFLAIADNSGLKFSAFSSGAVGALEKVGGKYMITEIKLNPVVVINDESDRERARRILEKSEAACLVSNSIKSTIHFNPMVELAEYAD